MKAYWVSLYTEILDQDNLKKYGENAIPVIKKLQKRFSPYCSVATWYLWRSIDDDTIQY